MLCFRVEFWFGFLYGKFSMIGSWSGISEPGSATLAELETITRTNMAVTSANNLLMLIHLFPSYNNPWTRAPDPDWDRQDPDPNNKIETKSSSTSHLSSSSFCSSSIDHTLGYEMISIMIIDNIKATLFFLSQKSLNPNSWTIEVVTPDLTLYKKSNSDTNLVQPGY